jgi:MerC mercury resistance protein
MAGIVWIQELDLDTRAVRNGTLDRVAMTLSGLCLVHCLATALLLGTLSTVGGLLGSPIVHEVGLGLALVLGVLALGNGILEHGRFLPPSIGGLGLGAMAAALTLPHGGSEVVATMLGVGLLATGHFLNRLALV